MVSTETAGPGHPAEVDGQAEAEKPVLFIIPGLMASELSVGDRPVWIDPQSLGQGHLEGLDLEKPVFATDPLRTIYTSIRSHFSDGHEVQTWAYDWRKSLWDAGEALASLVSKALDDTSGAVRILAHSTGGLVVRAMIHGHPETWDRMVERPGSRVVLVGTPQRGTLLVPQILLGTAPLVKALARVDFQSDPREVVRIFSAYPGLLELLPIGGHDFHSEAFWRSVPDTGLRMDWIFPAADALRAARETSVALAKPVPNPECVLHVWGYGTTTPAEMLIEEAGVSFRYSSRGDGVVLWHDEDVEDGRSWYVDIPHGKLLWDKASFPAFQQLVEHGDTDLFASAPERPADDAGFVEAPDEDPDRIPDWTYLACLAIGWPPPDVRTRPRPPIQARVLNADLVAAKYPVVVGHYKGDGLAHAEAALDYRLEHQLSRLHRLDLYPGEADTCEVVLTKPDETPSNSGGSTPSGAVVIGLGEVGSLSARTLTAGIRRGTLKYVEALRTAGLEEVRGLSLLLVGTSSLTVDGSIRALLRGIRQANEELEYEDGPDAGPAIAAIEFVELYRDRALVALDALRRVSGESEFIVDGRPLVQPSALQRHATGQRRVSFEPVGGWWDRLHIELHGDELRFTTPTGRARSEDSTVHIQADLMHRLLRRARDRKATEDGTPDALFELLVSNELKTLIGDMGNLVLVLDDGAAQFPWELLNDRFRGSDRPLSIGTGLIRSLRVDVKPPMEVARANQILVVGDPPSHWPELPGAQREAREVAGLFERTGRNVEGKCEDEKECWKVTTQIHGIDTIDASSVLRTLMTDKYRILHLAGHGDFRRGQPTRTGMVIGSRELAGTDEPEYELQLLRPHEVLQMPAVPELVFINCCHLGRQEQDSEYLKDRPQLASNLASQFIMNGVRAVVACGWVVGDRSAYLFSQQFYRQMLDGNTFGDAVTQARQYVWSTRRHADNTWGAFQCYGDPGFRLREPKRAHGASYQSRFVDTGQLLAELDNVVSRSKVSTGGADATSALRRHLEVIYKRLRPEQRVNGTVLARLAKAFGELGSRSRAIELYEQARDRASGGMSLVDLEQLANLRAREAESLFGAPPPEGLSRDEALAQIRTSTAEVERLLEIGATAERLSILASSYKSLTQVAGTSRERNNAVERMTEGYAGAAQLDPNNPYPLINALGGVLLMGGPWPTAPKRLRDLGVGAEQDYEASLERARSVAEARQGATKEFWDEVREFWDEVHVHDLALVRALYRGTLNEEAEIVAAGYEKLWHDLGSHRELDSIRRQVAFLVMIIRGSRGKKLERLRAQLPGLEALDQELKKSLDRGL